MKKEIETIIFDFGEVLAHLNFPHWIEIMQQINPDIDQSSFDIQHHRLNTLFSKGLISGDEMVNEYRLFLNSPMMSIQQIKRIHNSLFIDGKMRTVQLLPHLSQRYKLYGLSNTDPWHVEYLTSLMPGLSEYFVDKIYSYEAKSLKPEIEIFTYFQKRTGIIFSNTIYFDDYAPNIERGISLGINSVLVTGEEQLYKYISNTLLK
ncbi:MAG TPA: hypothetical protein DF296_06460 [Candidatus Margulisbacteria bacterium]|nr:MAG: hypothetical protein A2X43_10680 [Candidatus Margulisbacteria bacterium GWD2_39_127]OGI04443.1 MAG: hypothetical protein A2X42_04025 [Candidatus Margulisbacteria bacterium GWF2_38_17]OGI07153.1 MAG: hypothetical protein A2X41_06095 [Candidatus Margulisbacteria bacterium GWE2_39_32]HAR64394.1 hypothetical protein [Candidatus Margulisiibacteriota bacterium]HCT84825.1 hypothetical protein [Candidatus Margulisiibacteriota bacterium]